MGLARQRARMRRPVLQHLRLGSGASAASLRPAALGCRDGVAQGLVELRVHAPEAHATRMRVRSDVALRAQA
jgi:hypothetical protein